jgi:hypothetical protein
MEVSFRNNMTIETDLIQKSNWVWTQESWKFWLENADLRSDVVRCPTEGLGRLIASDAFLAHPEVSYLDMSVLVQQYIVQFQVSVNDPSRMQVEQPDRDLGSVEPANIWEGGAMSYVT